MEQIESAIEKEAIISNSDSDMIGRIVLSSLLGFIRFIFTINIPFATLIMVTSAYVFSYMIPEPTFWNSSPKPGALAYIILLMFWGIIGLFEPSIKSMMSFYKIKETFMVKIIAMLILIGIYWTIMQTSIL